jgi:hypothetical protein
MRTRRALGWVTIQAKKGLKLGEPESGPLADALRQLVDIFLRGVLDQPPRLERLRALSDDGQHQLAAQRSLTILTGNPENARRV